MPRDHLLPARSDKEVKIPSSLSRERDYYNTSSGGAPAKNIPHDRRPQNLQTQPTLSDTSSAGSPPAIGRRSNNNSYDLTSDLLEFSISSGQHSHQQRLPPDVTQFNANTRRGADRVTRYVNLSNTEAGDTSTAGRWKVSAKIQQLLNTLKRPKRRPLPEFYEDNDIELEIAANPKDPNAPKPEGSTMTPVQGEQLVIPSGLPRTLEAALQRYGSSSFKVSFFLFYLSIISFSHVILTYSNILSLRETGTNGNCTGSQWQDDNHSDLWETIVASTKNSVCIINQNI